MFVICITLALREQGLWQLNNSNGDLSPHLGCECIHTIFTVLEITIEQSILYDDFGDIIQFFMQFSEIGETSPHFMTVSSYDLDDISGFLSEDQIDISQIIICLRNLCDVGQADSRATSQDFPNIHPRFPCMHYPLWECPQYCMFDHNVTMSLFSPLLATRVGEASNPGPRGRKQSGKVSVAVCNPTAILQRKQELLQLDSQIILLSETSATNVVQNEFSMNLRQSHFRIFFGSPVVPKRQTIDGRDSLRGEAIELERQS